MNQIRLYDVIPSNTNENNITQLSNNDISLENYKPKKLDKAIAKANLTAEYNAKFLRSIKISLEALKDTHTRLSKTIEDDHVTEGYLVAEYKGTSFITKRLGLQIVKTPAPTLEGFSDDALKFGIEFKGADQVTEDDEIDFSLEGWTDDALAAAINLKNSIGAVLSGGFDHVMSWVNVTSKKLSSLFSSKKSVKALVIESQQAIYSSASKLALVPEEKYDATTRWNIVGIVDSVSLKDRVSYRNELLNKLPKLIEAIGRNIHVLGTARTVTEIEEAKSRTMDRLYDAWDESYSLIDSTIQFEINEHEGIVVEKLSPDNSGVVIVSSLDSLIENLKALDIKKFDKKVKKIINLIDEVNDAIQAQLKAIKLGKNDLDDEVKEEVSEYAMFLLQNITTLWELLHTATTRNAHTFRELTDRIVEETH